MPRKILHLDLDAFFCAVEEQRDPTLQGKPFAVGGSPDARGVVASCSYAARRYGIRSAMPMARAVSLCPDLIILSNRHSDYSKVSRQVMALVHGFAKNVEQLSIDEAFLEVTDEPEPAAELARRLQALIREKLDLPCSLGVATNKLVAKIATDVGKASVRSEGPPNAIRVVPPGLEAPFLAPLPAEALWGVGPKTAARLAELGLHTIGDIAAWPEDDLARRFGKHGQGLTRRARGIDNRPLETSRVAKSISRETTFARDVKDTDALHGTLRKLSDSVGRRLRRAGRSSTTVKLKVRWPDFTTLTRQITLEQPTDRDDEIYAAAVRLFNQVWRQGQLVRLVGVGVSGLGPGIRQLSLWEAAPDEAASQAIEKEKRLAAALDKLRALYGDDVVWYGKPAADSPSYRHPGEA
jgi:DNA polymerase-4